LAIRQTWWFVELLLTFCRDAGVATGAGECIRLDAGGGAGTGTGERAGVDVGGDTSAGVEADVGACASAGVGVGEGEEGCVSTSDGKVAWGSEGRSREKLKCQMAALPPDKGVT
jgi:hypothetical protein